MRKVLLTAGALLALCLAAAAAETVSQTRHKSSFAGKTETRRLELRVTEADRHVRLRVKFHLTSGELHLKLRDARGRVRQDLVLERDGKYDMGTRDLEAIAGVWSLEVRLHEATGSYEMVLESVKP